MSEFVNIKYSQNDCNLLLSIFPEEIWRLITRKILTDSPTDLESVSNASTYFRNLLLHNRVLFLFLKVFKLTVSTILWRTSVKSSTKSYQNNSVVLSYRKVCSTWNKAVDKLIKDRMFLKTLLQLDYLDNAERVALEVASNQMFWSVGQNRLDMFLNYFQKTHSSESLLVTSTKKRSPFVGGKVSILYYKATDDDKQFSKSISVLLQEYGRHVLHLNLRTDMDYNGLKVYKQISQWFAQIPNIISLELSTLHKADGNELINQNKLIKFPKFHSLRTLKAINIPKLLLNKLTQNNCCSISTL